MMFGVTEYIAFSNGRRVVITDPNQTNDPLSEALAAVAIEVKTRRELEVLCLVTIQNAPGAVHTQEFSDIRT
jgi:hypothetical protein